MSGEAWKTPVTLLLAGKAMIGHTMWLEAERWEDATIKQGDLNAVVTGFSSQSPRITVDG